MKTIDLPQKNSLDVENMALTIRYDSDSGWSQRSFYLKALDYLAKNQNDPMAVDIDRALEPHGLRIDDTNEHNFDMDTDSIEIHLTKSVK